MVAVVESTGAVFTVAFAQVMALWRKCEVVTSHERGDERSVVTMHDLITTYSWDQLSSERWNALMPFAVSI